MYANITNCKESLVFMIKLKREELITLNWKISFIETLEKNF